MKKYQTEKAIIDALLKISEIIKKTNHSKKTTGDGDTKQQRNEIYDVPISPSICTRLPYVSGFNQQYAMSSLKRPLNCNRAPIVLPYGKLYYSTRPDRDLGNLDKRHYSISKRRRLDGDYRDRETTYQHHRYDIWSSSTGNDYRRKSSRHHAKRKLSGSNKSRRIKCKCQTSRDNNEYSASDC